MEKDTCKSPNTIRIGIIGGGQLGRMIILEGKKLGIKFVILDPDTKCPASSIADDQLVGDYYDKDMIKRLVQKCDIVTYEIEHIDADVLMELEGTGEKIQPSPKTLKLIQNKYRQKDFLRSHNIAIPYFEEIKSVKDIEDFIKREGLPVVLKSCYGGYDGKGNKLIRKIEDIKDGYEFLEGDSRELMVERYVSFSHEVSVIVARSIKGEIKVYPVGENIHEDNILRTTVVPARIDESIRVKAQNLALGVMKKIEGAGVFAIEMFVDKDGEVLINEIAPRVHNSGHYTLEGCNISQFEQHIRAIVDLPLGTPYLIKPAVMINLLGEEDKEGEAILEGSEIVLEDNDAYIHFYGKEKTKPLRKMGHVTLLGVEIEEILSRAEKIRNILKVTTK